MRRGAEAAQREVDPRLVVPAGVEVQCRDEFLDGRGDPVARGEHLGLQSTEEALTSGVVR